MLDYNYTEEPNYHIRRRKQLMEKYAPEIKKLSGPNPTTAFWIIAIVSGHFATSWFVRDLGWGWLTLLAYFFGAFFSHALYVLIHEACHNVVLKTRNGNKLMGLICDLPLVLPSALAFRKYHMYHHRNLGDMEFDPDVTAPKEAAFIGSNPLLKTIWIAFFFLSQAFRPMKLKSVKLMNPWILTNILLIVALDLFILFYFGEKMFGYLALSTFFGLGLHPLGGRWIQEHYVTRKGQETYSYYGPLNKVCFNMGYHNEHHDLMNIPWNNLPKLKKLAPEFYDNLESYDSWTKVLWNFIVDKKQSPFNRIVHVNKAEAGA